jgi:hypothetical protein
MNVIEVSYGVATNELERANSWIEEATGLKGRGRESYHRGGDYYHYEISNDEEIYLCNNADLEFPNEAVTGAPMNWRIAMDVIVNSENSPVLRFLDSMPDRFVRLPKHEI